MKNMHINGIGSFNLGYEYSEPIYVFKISFKQRGTGAEGIDNIILQYSDDGTNWKNSTDTIVTARDGNLQEYIANKSIGKHKYWRIIGNGYGTNGGVRNLQFYGIK